MGSQLPPAQPAVSLAQELPLLKHLQLTYTEGQHLESWQALLQGQPQLCSLELVMERSPATCCTRCPA